MNNNRIQSIDILKFFAVLLITHSHMEVIYGPYKSVCTGGAIGDALFFFISGFTLFLGRESRFDNWYKRRINRIYPTVFCWALISCILFGNQNNFVQTVLHGGGGFVSCIMLCYIPLYLIKRYLVKYLQYVMLFSVLLIVFLFFFICDDKSHMFASNNIMWPFWCFSMMLLGAIIGHKNKTLTPQHETGTLWTGLTKVLFFVTLYYAVFYASLKLGYDYIAICGLIPLFFVVYYLYRLTNYLSIIEIYQQPKIHKIVYYCGSLCLEVYLVQPYLYTDRWNDYIPLNILVYWIVIFIFSFILKVFSNFFIQTFRNEDYNWKEIIKLS